MSEPRTGVSAAARRSGVLQFSMLFFRLVKFEHTIFALPFAYAGAFLAQVHIPGLTRMFWITVVMVAARSLAMALNRLLDAEMDALNPRTLGREIPAGRLSRAQVWVFCLISLAILVYATFHLPVITRYLWPVVVAPFVVYPLTKRWTWMCHLILGGTIGLGPVGAWVAVTGTVTWQPFLLGGAVGFWIAGFDVIYSCMDEEFDRAHGIHSIPADLGMQAGLWCTRAFHLVAVGLLAAVGFVARGATGVGPGGATGVHWLYFVGVGVCAALLFYENWVIRRRDLSKVGLAFMTVNSILSVCYFVFTTVAVALS